MAEDLEFKLKYPKFTARNYVVAVYDNPDNKPMWDAANFFIARWLLSKPSDLEKALGKWLENKKPDLDKRLEDECIKPIFNLNGEYRLNINGNRVKKLTDLTVKQLYNVVRERIHQKFGSYNLMDLDYKEMFFLNDINHKDRWPHSGDLVLTTHSKPKSGGTKDRRYHTTQITAPFKNNRYKFSNLTDDCKDFFHTSLKEGYTPGQIGCVEIAASLLLARYHPEIIKNLREVKKRNKSDIILPFHVHKPKPQSQKTYSSLKGKQPDLTYLMVDVMFDMLFNKHNKPTVSKSLTKIPAIFDSYLMSKIYDGKAGFEVVTNKYIFERSNPIPLPVREWFNQMDNHYEKKLGFKFNRMVYENKGSDNEIIAVEYVKGNEVRRLLFSDMPPLERKMVFDNKTEAKIFYLEEQEQQPEFKNPYEILFQPIYGKKLSPSEFDDASRKMPIFSEIRIPWFIGIPEAMIGDYHKAIEANFKGGNKKFIASLFNRNDYLKNTKYSDEIVDRMSLFKKISKAKKLNNK